MACRGMCKPCSIPAANTGTGLGSSEKTQRFSMPGPGLPQKHRFWKPMIATHAHPGKRNLPPKICSDGRIIGSPCVYVELFYFQSPLFKSRLRSLSNCIVSYIVFSKLLSLVLNTVFYLEIVGEMTTFQCPHLEKMSQVHAKETVTRLNRFLLQACLSF